MLSAIALGDGKPALALWNAWGERLRRPAAPLFRLLRCHASREGCAEDFANYAER
jgi:hypothetical protein